MTHTTSTLEPLPAQQRRAIYILPDAHIERLDYEKDGTKLLLNKQIQIVSYEQMANGQTGIAYLDRIFNSKDFGEDVVLVQSPFEADVYAEMSSALNDFALAKYLKISEVCQTLGARSIKVLDVQASSKQQTTTGSMGGGVGITKGGVEAEASFVKNASDNLKSRLSMHDMFPGGSPNPEKARKILEDAGIQDLLLESLIQQRAVETNLITKKELTLSLSSESKRNLNIVAKVTANGPMFLKKALNAHIGGSFSTESISKLDYEVTFEIQF